MIGLFQNPTSALLHCARMVFLMALFGIATKTWAQEDTFDCVDLMVTANLTKSPQPSDEVSYFTLVAADYLEVPKEDPVDPIELLERRWGGIGENTAIYTVSKVEQSSDPQFAMVCYLIIIEFELKKYETSLDIEDLNGNDQGRRLPILVVMTEDTEVDLRASMERWQANKFNISARFEGFQDGRREVNPEDFKGLRAFEDPFWDFTSVRMIGVDNVASSLKVFLSKYAPSAEQIMVMCGFGPCHEAPAPQKARATDIDASSSIQALNPTSQNPPDASAQGAITSTSGSETEPTSVLTPKAFMGGFTYIQRDGTETAAPFDKIDRLECILLALEPNLFIAPIDSCDNPAFKALGETSALLRLGPENQIQVVAEARYPDLELVRATLPLGVDGLTCQLSLGYIGRDGQTINIGMEPVPGSIPAAFEKKLMEPPQRDGIEVSLSILPLDQTACGVTDTYLQVSSAKSIDISLGEESSTTAILHLMLPRATQMAEDLALDEAGRAQFVQNLINAVRGAHMQLSARSSDNVWSLTQTRLMSLTEVGDPNVIVALDSESLRNGGADAFRRIGPDVLYDVADSSPQITAGTLSELLTAAGTQLSENEGADKLVVTLIAPIARRTALELGDPCTDPLYQQLSEDLEKAAMIDTEVFVFPLVRMMEGDQIDITRLQPVNPDTVSPTLPSGLYQCVDSPKSISILPYYFEPWRDPVEFAPRFATSLSGGLMMVLADANSQGANE